MNIGLRVENLNPYSVTIAAIQHQVTKTSDPTVVLAHGTTTTTTTTEQQQQQYVIPAQSDKIVTVPAVVRFAGMGAAAQSLCTRGMTTVKITCVVTIASHTMGKIEIPVVHTVDIALG